MINETNVIKSENKAILMTSYLHRRLFIINCECSMYCVFYYLNN